MKTLKIVLSPDPGLRSVCEECTVGDKSLIKLSKQMLKTMYANNGCGLAAPQVGMMKEMPIPMFWSTLLLNGLVRMR